LLPSDWQRLYILAAVVDRLFQAQSAQFMAEIRLNEERFGATPTNRLRLGYRLVLAANGPGRNLGFKQSRDQLGGRHKGSA
jgi:hypothetical protein